MSRKNKEKNYNSVKCNYKILPISKTTTILQKGRAETKNSF